MTARKIIYTIINTASLTQHYYEHYNYNYIDTEATETTDQGVVQCDQSSQAKVGGADPQKKFIGKNSKTP